MKGLLPVGRIFLCTTGPQRVQSDLADLDKLILARSLPASRHRPSRYSVYGRISLLMSSRIAQAAKLVSDTTHRPNKGYRKELRLSWPGCRTVLTVTFLPNTNTEMRSLSRCTRFSCFCSRAPAAVDACRARLGRDWTGKEGLGAKLELERLGKGWSRLSGAAAGEASHRHIAPMCRKPLA